MIIYSIIDLKRTFVFVFHFFLKVELIIPSNFNKKIFITTCATDFSSRRNFVRKSPPLMRDNRYCKK